MPSKDKDRFTFTPTEERLEKIKKHIPNPDTPDTISISKFINRAIDYKIKNIETRHLSDFIYYLGLPTLAFLGMLFLSLTLLNLFFYILTTVIGGYIVILFFLFYNKYKKVKK